MVSLSSGRRVSLGARASLPSAPTASAAPAIEELAEDQKSEQPGYIALEEGTF